MPENERRNLPDWFIDAGYKLPRNFELTVYTKGYKKRVGRSVRHMAGRVSPVEARRAYLDRMPALLAGEVPTPVERQSAVATIGELAVRYCRVRQTDVARNRGEAGAITATTYVKLRAALTRFLDAVGRGRLVTDLRPADFAAADRRLETAGHSYDARRRCAKAVVAMLRHAADEAWVDTPAAFGRSFRTLASRNVRRPARDLFSRDELAAIIGRLKQDIDARRDDQGGRRGGQSGNGPATQLLAMILLGLNGGVENLELASLRWADRGGEVDLDEAVIDRPRGKTGAARRVMLWPESVAALQQVRRLRPNDDLVFRTQQGRAWVRTETHAKGRQIIARVSAIDSIGLAFGKLRRRAGVEGGKSRGFYSLRHLHATAADSARDPHAASRTMGHALPGMKDVYVGGIDDVRLRRLVGHVRARLIGGLAI